MRTCDGYYFPISNSTSSTRFAEDEQTCQKLCPASEVALYSHRNPGEDIAQAVANNGRLYKDMPNAFRYRREFVATCGCRLPGQSWADALGQIKDSTVERGDIVVTEEKAKAMSQPAAPATRTATPAPAGQAPTALTPPRADAKRTRARRRDRHRLDPGCRSQQTQRARRRPDLHPAALRARSLTHLIWGGRPLPTPPPQAGEGAGSAAPCGQNHNREAACIETIRSRATLPSPAQNLSSFSRMPLASPLPLAGEGQGGGLGRPAISAVSGNLRLHDVGAGDPRTRAGVAGIDDEAGAVGDAHIVDVVVVGDDEHGVVARDCRRIERH